MAKEDFYKILGVKKDAKPDEIKKAYRRLARKYHPDVNPGDKAAEDRFKQMSEAFDVLSDPKKRKVYDRFGQYSDNLANAAEAGPAGSTYTGAPRSISRDLILVAAPPVRAPAAAASAISSRTYLAAGELNANHRGRSRNAAPTSRCLCR
jgi:DnaJ-class molecular chaperone